MCVFIGVHLAHRIYLEKPALPLKELNAEHFALSLFKGERLFPDLGTCVLLSYEQLEISSLNTALVLLKLVDLYILVSLLVTANPLRPHSLSVQTLVLTVPLSMGHPS